MPAQKFNRVFDIQTEEEFNNLCLEVFKFQYQNCEVYRRFSDSLGIQIETIKHFSQIPFLPVEFFKTHEILSVPKSNETIVFTSSTTTSQSPSKHYVNDITVYEKSFLKGFELFYGKPKDYCILALLPGYLERSGSSLVYMFDRLIKLSADINSGFFLHNYDELIEVIKSLKINGKKTILIGVTYALLDLSERGIKLSDNFIVMETGGMKGKRQEMIKEELHAFLKQKLGINTIHSEYGMTELLSQAYSKGDGIFECPPWMRILIRDAEDPLSLVGENKTGGINVIDLANWQSCSFIATKDLGRLSGNKFEVMGRFDNSDVRGCNLMID
ncbi:MAG: acyl transferase [Bacteroidetes bacterium]|nr:acyl transferase [Bacteroidota bacterium]